MNKKAFTLVELIVVITILAVLATIAFISFQWYAASSRDSVRLADMKSMEKVNTIFKQTTGKYPIPNDNTSITYSWSTAWMQWVFWQNSYWDMISMSNVPTDPLTQLPYAYSVTAARQEYQMATVLENTVSLNLNSQIYAWDQIANVYIKWDYNGKFLKVQTGSLDYLLWVPSIIASDITSVDVIDIIYNQKLVYKWYSNLPVVYSWSVYDNNWWFAFVPNQVVLFEWDMSNLVNNQTERVTFLDNLQTNYWWTIISSESEISEILVVNWNSSIGSSNYVAKTLNNTLKTKIPINKSTEIISESIDVPEVICENLIWTPYGQQIQIFNKKPNKFAEFMIPKSNAFDLGWGFELPWDITPNPTIYYIGPIDLCDNIDLGLNVHTVSEITNDNIVDVYRVNLVAYEEYEIIINSVDWTFSKEVYIFDKDANGLAYANKPLFNPTYTGIHYITVSPAWGNPTYNWEYSIGLKLNLNVAAPFEESF